MTHYRHRGLETVVDTTKEAEFDYALHQIDEKTREYIAGHLKEIPTSERDRVDGHLRIREICKWDVMFAICVDKDKWVITIAGIEPPGKMEPLLNYLWRSLLEALPAPFRILVKGRRRK